jgi:hypothetical protein
MGNYERTRRYNARRARWLLTYIVPAALRILTPNGEVVMVVTWSPTLNIGVTFGGRHHCSRYHYAVGLKVGYALPVISSLNLRV